MARAAGICVSGPRRTRRNTSLMVGGARGYTAAMLVAVEAKRLAQEVRGIGRYVRALLPRLVLQGDGLRLALFVRRGDMATVRAMFDSPELRDCVDVRPIGALTRATADVFWYPWNTANPAPARGCVVATMHDVVPIAHPDPRLRGTLKNLRWRRRYTATAKRATLIIADSQFSADEAHRTLHIPHERMRVVLLAADDFVVPPPEGDAEILARLGVTSPFVLAVGAADRRKNLALLDRAMPRVIEHVPTAQLVLAGPRRRSSRHQESWRKTLGFVSDRELAALYRGAEALVQPSTYEGFGLPVLEAMQLGTPVICARASSLPEVAGDAATWVVPSDDVDFARAIVDVLTDFPRRARMSAASIAQASRFTWDETARETIAAFEDAVALCREHGR